MARRNSNQPISTWEAAINLRKEIELEQFNLKDGGVISAVGYIKLNGKRKRVTWLHDGRCYYRGRRIVSLDVTL